MKVGFNWRGTNVQQGYLLALKEETFQYLQRKALFLFVILYEALELV